MKYAFSFVFICLMMMACDTSSNSHLPREKMQKILYDIHIAETYSVVVMQDSSNRNAERNLDSLAHYYNTIFKHYDVTAAQFNNSLDWYKQNPSELDSIYVAMIPEMSKLEGKYTAPVQ